jgi:hypothetical protein
MRTPSLLIANGIDPMECFYYSLICYFAVIFVHGAYHVGYEIGKEDGNPMTKQLKDFARHWERCARGPIQFLDGGPITREDINQAMEKLAEPMPIDLRWDMRRFISPPLPDDNQVKFTDEE